VNRIEYIISLKCGDAAISLQVYVCWLCRTMQYRLSSSDRITGSFPRIYSIGCKVIVKETRPTMSRSSPFLFPFFRNAWRLSCLL